MVVTVSAELILIRHGATDAPGHLNGRTDVGLAAMPGPVETGIAALWISPARRAEATAAGLFPGTEMIRDARLWEQDFGEWDGMAYADLPDLGDLDRDALTNLKGAGGESFRDMLARVTPALQAAADQARKLDGPVAVVAHAGVVRAGLALATGSAAGALAFEVDHLSATRLRCLQRAFAVISANGALT